MGGEEGEREMDGESGVERGAARVRQVIGLVSGRCKPSIKVSKLSVPSLLYPFVICTRSVYTHSHTNTVIAHTNRHTHRAYIALSNKNQRESEQNKKATTAQTISFFLYLPG